MHPALKNIVEIFDRTLLEQIWNNRNDPLAIKKTLLEIEKETERVLELLVI